tara:strand:- start:5942 stop:7504 length:1563 start_codon:yes stop_codon:yes gene_type:complete
MVWNGWNFLIPTDTKIVLEIGNFPHISNLELESSDWMKIVFPSDCREISEFEKFEEFLRDIRPRGAILDCILINADSLKELGIITIIEECESLLSPSGKIFVYSKKGTSPVNKLDFISLEKFNIQEFHFLGFPLSNAILFSEIHSKEDNGDHAYMKFEVTEKLLKHFQQIKYRSRRVYYFLFILRVLNYFRLSRIFFRQQLLVFVRESGLGNSSEEREHEPWVSKNISVLPTKRKNLVPVFSENGDLRSFCKYSSGKQGEEIISNEVKILKYLANYEFHTAKVPKVLNFKTCLARSFLEISSKSGLKYPKKMSDAHVDWLIELFSKTSTSIPFHKSEFFSEIQEKLKVINHYFKEESNIWLNQLCEEMLAVIDDLNLPFGVVQREFPFYHANMIGGSEKMFVFDWEFGRVNYPPLFDLFHCMLSDKHISGAESVPFPERVLKTLFISKEAQVFVKRYIKELNLPTKVVYPLFVLFLIDQLACYLPFVDRLEEVSGYLDALQEMKNKSSFSFEKWMSDVSI